MLLHLSQSRLALLLELFWSIAKCSSSFSFPTIPSPLLSFIYFLPVMGPHCLVYLTLPISALRCHLHADPSIFGKRVHLDHLQALHFGTRTIVASETPSDMQLTAPSLPSSLTLLRFSSLKTHTHAHTHDNYLI